LSKNVTNTQKASQTPDLLGIYKGQLLQNYERKSYGLCIKHTYKMYYQLEKNYSETKTVIVKS